MKRLALALLLPTIVFAQPTPAPQSAPIVRPFAAFADLSGLTDAQRMWLAAFEADGLPAEPSTWLARQATAARAAGLVATADYLAEASNAADAEAIERAWRKTLDTRLIITIKFEADRQ